MYEKSRIIKQILFGVEIPRKICLLKIGALSHWMDEGPECSYFKDILKLELLLHVCNFCQSFMYIGDKLSP